MEVAEQAALAQRAQQRLQSPGRLSRRQAHHESQAVGEGALRGEREPAPDLGKRKARSACGLHRRAAQRGTQEPGRVGKDHEPGGLRVGQFETRNDELRERCRSELGIRFEARELGEVPLAARTIEHVQVRDEGLLGEEEVRYVCTIRGQVGDAAGHG